MSATRMLSWICLCGLMFASEVAIARQTRRPTTAAQSTDANAGDQQELLKRNAVCNAAELHADVRVMDDCETSDFTHTHANGLVEYKAGYLKGIGSGSHRFLAVDLSEIQVRYYGGAAIIEAHLRLKANNDGQITDAMNHLTIFWVKQHGVWREAAWISRRLPNSADSDRK